VADLIVLTAEIACKLHEAGHITREELVRTLEKCINAAAISNGYVDKLGLPFPDTKFDDSDLETATETESEHE
jgi:HD superfamily phosphodiesterase